MRSVFFVLFLGTFLFANSLSEILKAGEIRIGVWNAQPPFSSFTDGKFSGFEVAMAKEIGRDIVGENGKVTLVGIDNVSERVTFLEQNKVDLVIASFTVNKEREKIIDFSMPYFAVAQGVLVNDDSVINSIESAREKVASVQKGADFAINFAQKNNIKFIEVEHVNDQYKLLKENKVDMMINDNLIVLPYPILDRKVIVPKNLRNVGASSYLAVGAPKNSPQLIKKVNSSLVKLSKKQFFIDTFRNTFEIFYRGELDPKYFLLEDIYRIFGDSDSK
ncbi:transporter substrate-binding domain-containing protein [Campylobacter sp. FMV-PI01]|uniref:Transporter substrate-binding domain-containing protein n=1 Tax=Campylobacter portucalensis TaxID=2608384 RepID=A0A6L5WLW6_9BACT|nr:transporter substrate-binding domain-containing protein [Campylobacter portucalensis]MSN96671.1 transporter substrate-binding domain-containing protein [Campylobacter portucalensis]